MGCLAVLAASLAGFLWQNPAATLRPGLDAELARQLGEEWLLAAFVGLLLGGLASYLVSGLLAGPMAARLDKLVRALTRARKGELGSRVNDPTGDEIAAVGEAFNWLMDSLGEQLEEATGEQRQFRGLVEEMREGVVLVDNLARLVYYNPAAARLLGLEGASVLGRVFAYVVQQCQLADALRRALELGTSTELEVVTSYAVERVLKATAFPARLGAEGASGACLVIRDISQMNRLETVRQQFVANASHELRTPLTAIRIIAESLQEGALNDRQAAKGFLEDILANTDRLAKLVDDMMELARLEALKEELELIELPSLASLCLERMTPLAKERGVKMNLTGKLSRLALGNLRNLESALVNVLDNALKYAASGKEVTVKLEESQSEVFLAVIDHGPGIPASEHGRVFERFWRVDKARSRELGGTGLGLSIVKHAMDNMGGRVWVEATPGGGATFVLALKLANVAAEEVEEPALF